MRQIILSFDLRGDFGVFKKPDVNDGLQVTFNLLHKPALLGILGAIAGLPGYQTKGAIPEYYQKLEDIQVGIEPLSPHEKGNFVKFALKYTNTVGYANADGNLIVYEQTLRSPAYRAYLLLNLDDDLQAFLYEQIKTGQAVFLPYFGKNECSIWWDMDAVQEFQVKEQVPDEPYAVATIFKKEDWGIRQELVMAPGKFMYFERLPAHIDGKMFQYHLSDFAYTNFKLKPTAILPHLYYLESQQQYVYLF